MKRSVLIVSICTLLVIGVAIAGQALVVTQGVFYTPAGLPANATPLAISASVMAGAGLYLSFPLTLASGVLGLIATELRQRHRWTIAVAVAGLLAALGLFGMIWIFLSVDSPAPLTLFPLVTPFALVPLVTLFYCFQPDMQPARVPRATPGAR